MIRLEQDKEMGKERWRRKTNRLKRMRSKMRMILEEKMEEEDYNRRGGGGRG